MERKVVCIIGAVLAFFVGAILVSEFPTIATLIAFLEVIAGFICGNFFRKFKDESDLLDYNDTIVDLKKEIEVLKTAKVSNKKVSKVKGK